MNVVKNEPVLSAGVVTGIVVALAGAFGVVLDTSTTETIVVAVLPVIAALVSRRKVSPIA